MRIEQGEKTEISREQLFVNSYDLKTNKKFSFRKTKFLKGTNIFINEDYCQDTVEYRKELWEEVKVLRSQGKIAYLNYRSIVSRDKVPALSSETEISEY